MWGEEGCKGTLCKGVKGKEGREQFLFVIVVFIFSCVTSDFVTSDFDNSETLTPKIQNHFITHDASNDATQ